MTSEVSQDSLKGQKKLQPTSAETSQMIEEETKKVEQHPAIAESFRSQKKDKTKKRTLSDEVDNEKESKGSSNKFSSQGKQVSDMKSSGGKKVIDTKSSGGKTNVPVNIPAK